jgi:hypothetical protein
MQGRLSLALNLLVQPTPPEILWGSFEVRRLSTDTPRNCPNQILVFQRCGLEVNDYCARTAWESQQTSRFGNGLVCHGHLLSGSPRRWNPTASDPLRAGSCARNGQRWGARPKQSQLPHPNVEKHDVRMGHPRFGAEDWGSVPLCSTAVLLLSHRLCLLPGRYASLPDPFLLEQG